MDTLSDLHGTRWKGTAELWLDPLGDSVQRSECSIVVDAAVVSFSWSHEGKKHQGSIALRGDVAEFIDSWHQPEPMQCSGIVGARGLFQVQGAYGPQADWGWRTSLCLRAPTGELVLQMTNIAPWGEEARAVRMTCERQS